LEDVSSFPINKAFTCLQRATLLNQVVDSLSRLVLIATPKDVKERQRTLISILFFSSFSDQLVNKWLVLCFGFFEALDTVFGF
jgi:hypothetical protein